MPTYSIGFKDNIVCKTDAPRYETDGHSTN
jgi:hypothetical protein